MGGGKATTATSAPGKLPVLLIFAGLAITLRPAFVSPVVSRRPVWHASEPAPPISAASFRQQVPMDAGVDGVSRNFNQQGLVSIAACMLSFAAGVLARGRDVGSAGNNRPKAVSASRRAIPKPTFSAALKAARIQTLEPPVDTVLKQTVKLASPLKNSMPTQSSFPREELDNVEDSIAEFVPSIAALRNQADKIRTGELKGVLGKMKEMEKTELGGVFTQVDQLLGALVGAIDNLRDTAWNIRKKDLRQKFDGKPTDPPPPWVKLDKPTGAISSSDDGSVETVKVSGTETMMEVHVIGLSHHKAPVEIREKLAVPQPEWNRYAKGLVEFGRTPRGHVIPEVAVLSTCNRFEIYLSSPMLKNFAAIETVHAFLREKSNLSREELEPYLFTHSGGDAIRHLFEVSSGLDSLVLGEAQILAQVKACHQHSIEKAGEKLPDAVPGSGGKIVSKMLNAGIRIGKMARTKTAIGKGSVSVSSAAVEFMVSKALVDLKKNAGNLHVCIVGAGKMSRLLLLALFSKLPDVHVTVVNRSVQRAQEMLDEEMVASRGGKNARVVGMDQLGDALQRCDVVFAATGSKEPVVTRKHVAGRKTDVMLIDISVPRNISTDCGQVEGAHLYSVDDLKKVMEANTKKRQSEVVKAKDMIEDESGKFRIWQTSQGAVPYLTALQSMAEDVRKSEIEKTKSKLKNLERKERECVEKLTRRIIDQVFKPIYYSLKEDEGLDSKRSKILGLKQIFNLEPEYKRRLLPSGPLPIGQRIDA